MVIAGQTAVRNAIAAAIESGAFQKIENALEGVVNIAACT
jgi:hypothetical protein